MRPLEEKYIVRLVGRIDFDGPEGCWLWTGTPRKGSGYGQLHAGVVGTVGAHRAVWETFVEPLDRGLELDHLCRNRACVNPDHLEPVTHRVNMLRSPVVPAAANALKTHCKNGHEFTPENTGKQYGPRGGRLCLTCKRDYQREWMRRYRQQH